MNTQAFIMRILKISFLKDKASGSSQHAGPVSCQVVMSYFWRIFRNKNQVHSEPENFGLPLGCRRRQLDFTLFWLPCVFSERTMFPKWI